MRLIKISSIGLLVLLNWSSSAAQPAPKAPPNAPAQIEITGGKLILRYAGRLLFEGEIEGGLEPAQRRENVYRHGDRVEQVLLLSSAGRGRRVKITGMVSGGEESFPCEIDRPNRGPLLVRHTSGLSRNLRNRAVYDRAGDWALSIDFGPKVILRPRESAAGSRAFSLECEGNEIVLRFRPRYYQQHRGLRFFEPWTYRVWPKSVTGWISWFAFFDAVTEQNIVETADVFSEKMGPFGYEYLQIDDGYQSGRGAPSLWLTANSKFPRGLKFLADYIKSKGLKPGLWTAASFSDGNEPQKHPEWFVRDAGGAAVKGNWIDHVVDASNPAALATLVAPLYKELRAQGWEYFKVDALRHLRYEGYNAHREYFEKRKIDLVAAYRRYAETIRNEIGRGVFMLGCWGIRPELISIIDGCRIGDDGFAYAGLSQYNSFNNIVWRNDPDHIELNDDRYRSTLVTSLTGSILLLTDKPGFYRTGDIEPAKRTAPVLFTLPGQVYDVDPSRSDALARVDVEVSGSGPRPFDAGYTPACHLYLLEIERPFEDWAVLGRTGGDFSEIFFSDLGLDPQAEYFVFEFWTKTLLGSFSGRFQPGAIDSRYRSQAFCIRPRLARPQLIATNRHVTCGGVDLVDVRWENERLNGKSQVVGGDPYVITLTQPKGFEFADVECRGASVQQKEKDGYLVKITLLAPRSGEIEWTAKYDKIEDKDDDILSSLGIRGAQMANAVLDKKVKTAAALAAPATGEELERRREGQRRELTRSLGLDPLPPRTPLNARITGILKRPGYRIEKLVFDSRPDFPVTAHLYVPDGPAGRKFPVIVNPHGHWGYKKNEPTVQSRLIGQVLHGYLAIVVESPGFSFEGDRRIERRSAGTHDDLRLILGSQNATSVYVWDLMRAVDYLATRPEADTSNIGLTGASGGGRATMWAFAAEPRFTCAASVVYASSLEINPNNGCLCNHVPGSLQMGDRADVFALRAPAPVLIIGAEEDPEFPAEGMRLTGEKLKRLWGLFGKSNDAWLRLFPGGHDYSRPMRETALGFFDKYLKGVDGGAPVKEPNFKTESPDAPELFVLAEPPQKTLTMRGIAEAMFEKPQTEGTTADYIKLNGGLPAAVPAEVKELGEFEGRKRVTFVSEAGLTLPAIVWPAKGKTQAVAILVTDDGKAAAEEEFAVERLVKKGITCIALDPRGIGEVKGLDLRLQTYLGQAPAFGMGWDITRAVAAFAPAGTKVAVIGRGPAAGQAALAAALLEPRVGFAAGLVTLKEFSDAFRDDVPLLAIQPRANYAPSLSRLRALLKAESVWSFLGEREPQWRDALVRWAEK